MNTAELVTQANRATTRDIVKMVRDLDAQIDGPYDLILVAVPPEVDASKVRIEVDE